MLSIDPLACTAPNQHGAEETRSPKRFNPMVRAFRRHIPNRDKSFFDNKLLAEGNITPWAHVPMKVPKRFKHTTVARHLSELEEIDSDMWSDDE